MEYSDPHPRNQRFVKEVQARRDFNNLHCHLPGEFYRDLYKNAKESNSPTARNWEKMLPLWNDIDEFIQTTGLDYLQILKDFEGGGSDPRLREKSQIALCPLYVFLRGKGFTVEQLVG